jgi:hypothetical protein
MKKYDVFELKETKRKTVRLTKLDGDMDDMLPDLNYVY